MNADLRISNSRFDLQLWTQRCRLDNLRINGVGLWRSCADERKRNAVLSRFAVLQPNQPLVRMTWSRIVHMSRKSVVVLSVIVIVVGVGVQQRR